MTTCCRFTGTSAIMGGSCRMVNSWIEPGFRRCFQIMECDDARLLQEWVLGFHGLGAHFEIVPVVPSAETREVVAPFLK